MSYSFGEFNSGLTAAVKRIAHGSSEAVFFLPHAIEREQERHIDHKTVLTCLRKGKAYGPEWVNGELRANVVHLGLHVRVAIGGLEPGLEGDWDELSAFVVCTAMVI